MSDTDAMHEEGTSGSGPGFLLGVILGTIVGAAAATLFAPATGEEMRQQLRAEAGPILEKATSSKADTPVERVRGALQQVRSRVQEAAEEARQAAHLAEQQSQARYAQLTDQELA